MRSRAAPPAALLVAPLDSFTAVYHRASGITHLLVSPAPEILTALQDAALTAAALRDRLGEAFDLGEEDAGALDARLAELVAAGLVEALA